MGRGVWIDPQRSGVTLGEYSQAWLAERSVGEPLDRITPAVGTRMTEVVRAASKVSSVQVSSKACW